MTTTMMSQGGFNSNVEPPKILSNLEISSESIEEGEPVRLELQVTHTTDVQIDWYKDDQPLAAGSRYDSALERGFAHLDILYTLESDTGAYSCAVRNSGGEIKSNSVNLQVIPEEKQINQDFYVDQFAEIDLNEPERQSELEARYKPTQPPAFAKPITISDSEVLEGEGVRFEGQLAQAFDSTVNIEWFKDGNSICTGSRFNAVSDRDLIFLEIAYCFKDDSGSYVCKVKNAVGEIESQPIELKCIPEDKVVTRSILDEQSIQQLKAFDDPDEDHRDKNDFEADKEPESKPHFDLAPTTLLVAQGASAKFLVRISGNPTPEIEWTLNDEPIKLDSNVNIYKDGAINYLEINRCDFEQGGYKLKIVAMNSLGSAEAETVLSVAASEDFRPDLKHVKMANPFKKMIGLKKVEIDQELNKAFSRAKPTAESIIKMERGSVIKTKTFKSPEVLEAENILDKVAINLRKSEANKYLLRPEAI